jgi:hypothetical protein
MDSYKVTVYCLIVLVFSFALPAHAANLNSELHQLNKHYNPQLNLTASR